MLHCFDGSSITLSTDSRVLLGGKGCVRFCWRLASRLGSTGWCDPFDMGVVELKSYACMLSLVK